MAFLLFAAPSFDRITVPAADGPGSVAIADVNHDTYPDIVAGTISSN